jgi:excisionase family DNA binding protein
MRGGLVIWNRREGTRSKSRGVRPAGLKEDSPAGALKSSWYFTMNAATTVQAIAEKIFTSDEVKKLTADLISLALKPGINPTAIYTHREVATLTSVSRRTVERAVENGRLKTHHVGSEPRISGAAILQWLDEGGNTGRSKRNLLDEAA